MSTIRLMNGSTYQIFTKLKFVPIFSIAMVIITLWFSILVEQLWNEDELSIV